MAKTNIIMLLFYTNLPYNRNIIVSAYTKGKTMLLKTAMMDKCTARIASKLKQNGAYLKQLPVRVETVGIEFVQPKYWRSSLIQY